jgi:glutathione S-transferase
MEAAVTKVIGSYLSPYVRKVLVCLDIKAVPYEIDPIVPFYGNEQFERISPLRRIPVLVDDRVTLADSSVICEYLEERYPHPRLFPEELSLRARMRRLEEFADTRMGEVLIWHFFNQLVIRRFVWGETGDEEVLRKAREVEIPHVLDYLESQLPSGGYLFGAISVADVAIACFFRNAAFVKYSIDAARWPLTASFVARVLGHGSFERLRPLEELCLRTAIPEHRRILRDAGAPIGAETLSTGTAQRGILTT